MATAPRNRKKQSPVVSNGDKWYHSLERIGYNSFSRGLFPLFLICCVFTFIFWLLPEIDRLKAFMAIGQSLKEYNIFGWILLIAACIAWYFQSKLLRRKYSKELVKLQEQNNLFADRIVQLSQRK